MVRKKLVALALSAAMIFVSVPAFPVEAAISSYSTSSLTASVARPTSTLSRNTNNTSILSSLNVTLTTPANVTETKTAAEWNAYKWNGASVVTCSFSGTYVSGSNSGTLTVSGTCLNPTTQSLPVTYDIAYPSTPTYTTKSNSFTLSESSKSIAVGGIYQIGYSTAPSYNASSTTFSSNATSVATVNASGLVTGVSSGTATITVTSMSGISGSYNYTSSTQTFTITVTNKKESLLSVDSAMSVAVDEEKKLTITNAKGNVTCTSSDTNVATVTNAGVVTGKKAGGTATITVQDTGDDEYLAGKETVSITVTKGATAFSVLPESKELNIGDTFTIEPQKAKGTVSYVSSAPTIASVDSVTGLVTALEIGSATITATDAGTDNYDGGTDTVAVSVVEKTNDFYAIPESKDLYVDESFTIEPQKAKGTVSYVSSAPTIASVDSTTGLVKALKFGVATITATDAGGDGYPSKPYTITVTVKRKAGGIKADKTSATISVKGTHKISYTGASDTKNVSFVPDNSGCITVTADGTVTGVKAGTATVVVKDSGSDTVEPSQDTVSITVKKKTDKKFSINATSATVNAGKTYSIGYTAIGSVSFKSADTSIAKVSAKGVVTGVKAGTVKITGTDAGTDEYEGSSDTITIKVTKQTSTFALNATSKSIAVGKNFTIGTKNAKGTVKATIKSGTGVVTISGLKVTGKKAGKATITVTDAGSAAFNGASKTMTVTVTQLTQSVTLRPMSKTLNIGKTASIKINGVKTSKPTVTSSNKKVVTVSGVSKTGFKIKAIGGGSATVTVAVPANTSYKAKTVKLSVTVPAKQTLKVTPASVTLARKGKSRTLKVTGAKTKVTYKSSNTKVATVTSKGKIVAKKKGTCYITVTAASSSKYQAATKKIKVTVKK